jgi:phosphate-selective porin
VRAAPLAVLVASALAASGARAQGKKRAEPLPGWEVKPFSLENPSAGFKIALKGYVQADFRSFEDWTAGDEDSSNLRADEFEWRRLRIGVEGEWRRLSFEFAVSPEFDEDDELKTTSIGVRLAKPFQIRGGHLKLPVSPEWLTSASKTDFVERSSAVDSLGPSRDWGVVLEGEIARAAEYQAGVFEGDGRTHDDRARTTAAARLVLKPASWLHLGGSFSQGDVTANAAGPGLHPEPKGLEGTSVTGFVFFPPVFVDGRRLRWGADARIRAGPASLWGEFLERREQRKGQGPTREDLPDVRGDGWSANVTWLVTGDKKTRTIRPDRSLPGGPGAVELAARYEELRFDDVSNEGFESAGSRAANVRPAGLRAFTGGVSWWPCLCLRLVGDVVIERYDDALRAPELGKKGNYVSLLGRVQIQLP